MAITVESNSGGQSSGLAAAILLYINNHKVDYVSIHDIGFIGNDENRPYIGVGRPASQEALSGLVKDLMPNLAKSKTVIPSNILSYDFDHIAWYTKPGKKRLWFKCPNVGGEVSAEIDLPGLVFFASNSDWYVFAHQLNDRPDDDTPLYVSPFLNVWKDGKICTGNIKVPQIDGYHSTEAFEDAFFRSYFTHANIHEKGQLVNYPGGPYVMWEKLITGKLNKFPKRALVPFKMTVGEFLGKLNEGDSNAR